MYVLSSNNSIPSSIHEIPMDCAKFHMMCDVTLLLSTGRSNCQQCSHKVYHCSCIEQQVLGYSGCVLYNVFIMVFTLVCRLALVAPCNDLLIGL